MIPYDLTKCKLNRKSVARTTFFQILLKIFFDLVLSNYINNTNGKITRRYDSHCFSGTVKNVLSNSNYL